MKKLARDEGEGFLKVLCLKGYGYNECFGEKNHSCMGLKLDNAF